MDFLSLVVAEHIERLDRDTRLVLPCVHDDTEVDDELLTAMARRYGGIYVRCDEPLDDPPEVRGPINGPMARHLEVLCQQRNTVVSIAEVDGQIAVTVDGSEELTGSAATLGRVLATLCSEILSHELVVLSYSLADLDEARAALIWDALWSAQLFAPAILRTLVPIACGGVNVAAHCNREEGAVRLVVRGGEVIRRRLRTNPDARLHNMIDSLDRRIVLFLGAGASASCNVPQGDYLRNHAIAHLTGESVTSTDLVEAFRRWLEDRDRWMSDERDQPPTQFERNLTLERVLREEFFALNGRPRHDSATYKRIAEDCRQALERTPPGRKALWELAGLLPRLVVATVNFDELIEDGMHAEHDVVVGPQGFKDAQTLVTERVRGDSPIVPILKVHGTIAKPNSLVADIITTTRGLPSEVESVLDVVADDEENVLWIWVGCSMRDHDLRQWLRKKDGSKLEEWWVDPLPPRSVANYAADVRTKEWALLEHNLADRQITESSDIFLVALLDRVRALSGQ